MQTCASERETEVAPWVRDQELDLLMVIHPVPMRVACRLAKHKGPPRLTQTWTEWLAEGEACGTTRSEGTSRPET